MGKKPPFAPSAAPDYQAESDYRTLGDADRVSQDPLRKKAALAHGKSQIDTYARLAGKKPGKKRGFTPAMRAQMPTRSMSGGGR